jgi:cytochrome c oxidase subunit IV
MAPATNGFKQWVQLGLKVPLVLVPLVPQVFKVMLVPRVSLAFKVTLEPLVPLVYLEVRAPVILYTVIQHLHRPQWEIVG